MKTMHLFAGVGGGLLADLILGHDPIIAVEWDGYACQVLRERAKDGWFPDLSVWEGDVRLFDPSEYAGKVDCIHAGFPCQDISVAGNQAGVGQRHDPAFIEKSSVLLASFDPVTCSLKTCQQSLVTDSEPYSQTLPRWGSLRNGDVSEHPIAAHPITGTGGSVWPSPQARAQKDTPSERNRHTPCLESAVKTMFPTPTVTSGAQVAWDKTPGQTGGTTLAGYVKYWPTQTAHLAKETNAPSEATRNEPTLSSLVGGRLNPTWVEWLMLFPIEFTASKDWATRKSHCKPQLPGNSLVVNDEA